MWLLSSDGDLFDGKRIWLRPGTQLVLGRTSSKSDPGQHIKFIEHKSVSRRHIKVTTAPVDAGDVSKIHKRTRVRLEDDSKVGTTLNGVKFSKESRTLEEVENSVKLGLYEQTLRIVWQPVTLTFMNLSKKDKGDALAEQKQMLEGTDVRLLVDYVSNETTHVVAKKRNTAIGLQALVQGRRLVGYDWAQALATAASVECRDANGEPESLLQRDFDAHWPSEDDSVPPVSNEPVPREARYLKPNAARSEVFQDYVFVFLTATRFNELLPVITSGGGKALLWEVEIGESRGDDLVSYVKELAGGKKAHSQFRLSQQTGNGGVVIVRLGENDKWSTSFMQGVDQELEQESIIQNEFLDVVLIADASGLRRPSVRNGVTMQRNGMPSPASPPQGASQPAQPMENIEEQRPATQAADDMAQEPAEDRPVERPSEQPSATKKKWNRRVKSRFQGFEDFDPSQFSKPPSASPELSSAPVSQAMDVDPSQSAPVQQTQQSSRKRPAPPQDLEPEEDLMDTILTGQAALKRRKTEAAQRGEKNAFATTFTEADRLATEKAAEQAAKKIKQEQQLDVKAALVERRKTEEERRRKDEDALREQLENTNIEDIEIQVEEMEMPVRERPARRAEVTDGQRSERWDPAWDGRKNFKRFRRQGPRGEGPIPWRQVIVQLEEAQRPRNGIGDEYWLGNSAPSMQSSESKGKSQSKSQSQAVRSGPSQRGGGDDDDDEDENTQFRRRLQRSREEDAESAEQGIMDREAVAGTARDAGWRALAEQSQTFGTESQRQTAGKRPASGGQGGGAAKKARQTRLPTAAGTAREAEQEEEDDGLKFRRRKRV
ncbi:hypothetical protein LTR53_015721 [Teratosphaeriaceae sp. CCFEE 6253]|nr:hypothetical protein LTR53_015721 [Teratosphaeriaceae sp. CCFEE 6253]